MPPPAPETRLVFARVAWLTLAYTIAVVVWGAYVRATGSGAGCGAHWPLCDGVVLPRSPRLETVIELTHRVTSGIDLLLVLLLGLWARLRFPPRDRVRRAALASVLLMLSEALIGAGLVLFGLVADDRSEVRAGVLALHLTNTFLLLAALALTAHFARHPAPAVAGRRWSWGGALGALAAMLVIGTTGAVTALGDTLFPAESLRHGLAQDVSPTAHLLVRVRVWHPLFAVAGSIAIAAFATGCQRRFAGALGRLSALLVALLTTQLLAGAVNVALLAPVWLQLVHLALADAIWIVLVVLVAAARDAELAAHQTSSGPIIASPIGTAALPKGPG
ncbi:MAG TPA: COX15/CtaA family protein [Candidatus Limnocylindria bacterium]|nr:COX15/CtaA family protein [Candidatus Limnocylindria bacterium]